jgi:hypothetical protein
MKILKIIGFVLAGLIVMAVLFLAYMGFFSSIEIVEKETGPYTIVYESFIGSYAETGKVFNRVYEALQKDGVATKRGLGIYYDNPATVEAANLRSDCGVIIEEKDMAILEKIKDKYQIKTIEKAHRMTAEFPKKNVLSYMIGPMKVYPQFAKYVKNMNYKASAMGFEIYDEEKIIFMMDIYSNLK